MTVDEAKQLLEGGGLVVGEEKQLGNGTGTQLRVTGAVVNIYDKGSYYVQGSNKVQVEALLTGSKSAPVAVATLSAPNTPPAIASAPSRVFIVYGHDAEAREQLELILRRFKLEPVVLQNLSGGGDTIIENLDKLTNADFACVLLTPDDEGCIKGCSAQLRPRARQNVALEMGMVLAKLGRQRVAILVKDVKGSPLERPTDIDGLIYLPFENHVKDTTLKLAARLQETGFKIQVSDLLG